MDLIPDDECFRKQILSWNKRLALEGEALPKGHNRSELIKVHNLRLASEIWTRLRVEYGMVSDILHSKAELKFRSLRKKPTTPIHYINEFNKTSSTILHPTQSECRQLRPIFRSLDEDICTSNGP